MPYIKQSWVWAVPIWALETQADDQKGQYKKHRANIEFFHIGPVYFVLALFVICMKQAVLAV